MRGEGGAKSFLCVVGAGLGDWNKVVFERKPNVLVEPGSGVVAVGANALKTGIVAALIDSASFGDGGLDTRGVGAEDDFRSAINVAV